MTIDSIIAAGVKDAVKALYGADAPAEAIQIQPTKKGFEGDLTVVVFPLLRMSRQNPETTATQIGQWLADNVEAVAGFNDHAGGADFQPKL